MKEIRLCLTHKTTAAGPRAAFLVAARVRLLAAGFLLVAVLLCFSSGIGHAGANAGRLPAEAQASLRKIFKKARFVYETPPTKDILLTQTASLSSLETDNLPEGRILVSDEKGRILGYGYVDTVQGKWGPIQYLVALDDRGAVKEVVILATHEIRGKAVGKKRFRRQYRGKTCRDPLQLNKDIQGISGATQSSKALTNGVKKIVCFHEAWQAAQAF